MSFKNQVEEDLGVFINPDEFAIVARFSRSGLDIDILLDKGMDSETGRIIDLIVAKKSDIEGIKAGDTFTIGEAIYRTVVSGYQPIDELMCEVRVENDNV